MRVSDRHVFVWSIRGLFPTNSLQAASIDLFLFVLVTRAGSDQREDLIEICDPQIISIIHPFSES
jgi:hypothetical protein